MDKGPALDQRTTEIAVTQFKPWAPDPAHPAFLALYLTKWYQFSLDNNFIAVIKACDEA
jgi:hypothetical protein